MTRLIRRRASKRFKHYEGVYVGPGREFKGKRQAANSLEAQRMPEPQRPLIRADNEVELHCPVATAPGVIE